jgi:hypothetical protein
LPPDQVWSRSRSYWRPALALHALVQLLGVALLAPLTTAVARLLARVIRERRELIDLQAVPVL